MIEFQSDSKATELADKISRELIQGAGDKTDEKRNRNSGVITTLSPSLRW